MSDEEAEYLSKEARIEETRTFIRTHPKMFFGIDHPTEMHLTRELLSGVVLLTDQPVVSYRHNGWRVVAAAQDWLSLANIHPGRDVFKEAARFPEMGVNACHPETVLFALAMDVVTVTKEGATVVCGAMCDDDVLARAGNCLPDWGRLVVFRM